MKKTTTLFSVFMMLLFVLMGFIATAQETQFTHKDTGFSPVETFAVTFNVDMTEAEGFNPNRDNVYLTGSFTGWAEPGTPGSIVMSPSDQELIFTATVDLPQGLHEYKYFSDFAGDGWNGGEWPGDPNRVINVTGDMTVNDTWGIIHDPDGPYQVTFNVTNQAGQPVQNALIKVFTINDKANPNELELLNGSSHTNLLKFGDNPWNYDSASGFHAVRNIEAYVVQLNEVDYISLVTNANGQASFEADPGLYAYTVEKEGHFDAAGNFEVVGSPLNINVLLETEGDIPEYTVTFNLDMNDVEGFDPDEHSVYLTGTFTNWAEPGTEGSIEMVQGTSGDKQKSLLYHANVSLYEGYHQYKYFSDAFGDGWAGGEWVGDPNREILVTEPMVVDDVWGDIDPQPDPTQTVSFNVSDDSGMPLNDAMISVYPAADFGFDVVWSIEAYFEPIDVEPIVLFTDSDGNASFDAMPGYYSYTVEKEGYSPADGEFTVIDEAININVTMVPSDPGEYTITFNIVDEFEDPVYDAVITMGGITNSAGDYVFEDVPHGIHAYTVTRLCYHSTADEILINQEETITIMLDLNIMQGDANGDGIVNILDIITVSNFWSTETPPGNWCFHNADINSDGIINILDIIGISNIWAGGD